MHAAKRKTGLLRYAANLAGAAAAFYVVAGVLLRFLAERIVKAFHASATLANPIGVPESVIALLSVAVGALSLLAAIWFVRALGRPVFPMRLSFRDPKDRRVWMLIPVFLGFGLVCSVLSSLLQSGLSAVTRYAPPAQTALPESAGALALCLNSLCVVPAVLEEIFVRGCLQSMFLRWGAWFSIIASGLVFTLLHADIAQMPAIFLLSVFLGLCAHATGSLLPGVVLHLANNTMSFLFLYIQQRMDGRTAVGAVIYLFALLLFSAALCVWRIVPGGVLKSLRPLPKAELRKKAVKRLFGAPVFTGMALYLLARALWPVFVER